MSREHNPDAYFRVLRQRTELALTLTRAQMKKMSREEVQHLVQALQTQHIELEMQNEELRRTKLELEITRDRYAMLFDLTPVGYVTLDEQGHILEVNITFCHLLGLVRSNLLRKKLEQFVDPADQGVFRRYLGTLKMKAGRHPSDVLTLRHAGTRYRVRLKGFLEPRESSDVANQFRLAVEDMTVEESAREQHKSLLEAVVDGMRDAMLTIDAAQRIVLFNQAAEQMFRCSAAGVIGQPLDRLIPGWCGEAQYAGAQPLGQGAAGPSRTGRGREVQGRRADGEEFPAEISLSQIEMPERDGSPGHNTFCAVLLRDITAHRPAQDMIQKDQPQVMSLLDASAAFMIVMDVEGRMVLGNRPCERLTDRTLQEIQGQALWNILRPSLEGDKFKTYVQSCLQSLGLMSHQRSESPGISGRAGSSAEDQGPERLVESNPTMAWPDTIETALLDRTGRLCWVRWHITSIYYHGPDAAPYLIATGTDITARKQTERLLQENDQQFQAILDHSPVSIWLKDLDGRYMRVNQQFEHNVGLVQKEIQGKTDAGIFPGHHAAYCQEVDQQVMQAGHVLAIDELAPDGHHSEHVVRFPLMSSQGQPYGLCGMAIDISRRKEAEAVLWETSQRLESQQREFQALAIRLLTTQEEERRRIARDLHDDINQRLAVFNMKLDVVRTEVSAALPITPLLQELSEDIGNVADKIRHMAHQYHPSTLEHLGLRVALRTLCQDFSQWEQVPITWEVPEEEPPHCTPEMALCLYRVAQESLRNVKRHSQASVVRLVFRAEAQEISLSIEDNGRGFAMHGGLPQGLGFISMRERVRLVGGTFTVESQPGQGTTVSVTILINGTQE
jgi:PAS domain S-box-containing protein